MSQAITLFFQFWNMIINFVFNEMIIINFQGSSITIGWLLVGIMIIVSIIKLIIAMPKGSSSSRGGEE